MQNEDCSIEAACACRILMEIELFRSHFFMPSGTTKRSYRSGAFILPPFENHTPRFGILNFSINLECTLLANSCKFWRTFGVREQSCSETLITPFVVLIIHLFSDENISFIWISSRKSYSCARWPHYFYHHPNLAYIFKFLVLMFKFGLNSIILLFILLYLYVIQMHNITQ